MRERIDTEKYPGKEAIVSTATLDTATSELADEAPVPLAVS